VKLSQYVKKRGCELSVALIAKISSYSYIGLNTMYNKEKFEKLDNIINDSQARFKSICKKTKKGE